MHPVVRERDRHGSISVPLSDSPDLYWVRVDRLQPTCRAAGIEYAEGLEGFERKGPSKQYIRPILNGVVIARCDAGKLAGVVARSSRANAAQDAAEVVLELVWEFLPDTEWQVHSALAAVRNPARVAVWADALEKTHPDLAALLRQYICPDYPVTGDPVELFVRRATASEWNPAWISVITDLVRAGGCDDLLHRAVALLEVRGRDATEREIQAICRRHLDDAHC